MLTPERLEVLNAVQAGTVTARVQNAAGSRTLYEPKEVTVSMNFLTRAGLVGETRERTVRGTVTCSLYITERGKDVARAAA